MSNRRAIRFSGVAVAFAATLYIAIPASALVAGMSVDPAPNGVYAAGCPYTLHVGVTENIPMLLDDNGVTSQLMLTGSSMNQTFQWTPATKGVHQLRVSQNSGGHITSAQATVNVTGTGLNLGSSCRVM